MLRPERSHRSNLCSSLIFAITFSHLLSFTVLCSAVLHRTILECTNAREFSNSRIRLFCTRTVRHVTIRASRLRSFLQIGSRCPGGCVSSDLRCSEWAAAAEAGAASASASASASHTVTVTASCDGDGYCVGVICNNNNSCRGRARHGRGERQRRRRRLPRV